MSIDKLKEIVTGQKGEMPQAEDVLGNSFIQRSESWLEVHKNLSSEDKIKRYERDVGSRWQFTPNNKEYYWQTLENMSSLNGDQFKDFTKRDIRGQLELLKTSEEKEGFFRDNAHTWPSYVTEDLEEYFFSLRGLNDSKSIERNRINQSLELQEILDRQEFKLSPDVSLASHVEDMIKAYDYGYGNEIVVNEDGRIAVPKEGQEMPLFSMPKQNLPLEEEFISMNDLRPLVETKFKKEIKRERNLLEESEKLAKISLMNRAENGELPEQFVVNAILDGAAASEDPGKKLSTVALNHVMKKMDKNAFGDAKDALQYYYSLMTGARQTILRRLNDARG